MREFFHGWRRKAGVVTFVMVCVGVALLPRFLDPFDDASFNRSDWMSSTPEQRAKMARDVITKHIRRGATLEEIVALLGEPEETHNVRARGSRVDQYGNRLHGAKTYAYYLGSWSSYGLDDAHLYVHFDTDDRVLSAEVAGG
ncbi:MAG: hypothetical protein JWP89_1709 [Schlesneria sp.]|nr:hypothetical protein [Schlesneria sp.]